MSTTQRDDPLWQQAWQWVKRAHDGPLTAQEQAELVAWLGADPAHRRCHDEASRLWLDASLLPTRYVDPDPEVPLDVEALRRIVGGDAD